jgi:hypothetical protein
MSKHNKLVRYFIVYGFGLIDCYFLVLILIVNLAGLHNHIDAKTNNIHGENALFTKFSLKNAVEQNLRYKLDNKIVPSEESEYVPSQENLTDLYQNFLEEMKESWESPLKQRLESSKQSLYVSQK